MALIGFFCAEAIPSPLLALQVLAYQDVLVDPIGDKNSGWCYWRVNVIVVALLRCHLILQILWVQGLLLIPAICMRHDCKWLQIRTLYCVDYCPMTSLRRRFFSSANGVGYRQYFDSRSFLFFGKLLSARKVWCFGLLVYDNDYSIYQLVHQCIYSSTYLTVPPTPINCWFSVKVTDLFTLIFIRGNWKEP